MYLITYDVRDMITAWRDQCVRFFLSIRQTTFDEHVNNNVAKHLTALSKKLSVIGNTVDDCSRRYGNAERPEIVTEERQLRKQHSTNSTGPRCVSVNKYEKKVECMPLNSLYGYR